MSAGTRERVVDVAARLLQEQGPAAVTTRRVAQGAGVQAPVIYRLFGDKDGLLDAVAEHVMSTYVSAKSAIAAAASAGDVDPVDDLRTGWQTQMDFGLANPTLFALLSIPGRGPESSAARAGLEILRARVRRVASAGRLHVGEGRAVDLIHAAGTGAVLTLLVTPPDRRDPGLADAMFEAVLREILTDAPAVEGTGPTAAAVALRAAAGGLEVLTDAEQGLLSEWLDRAIHAAGSSDRADRPATANDR